MAIILVKLVKVNFCLVFIQRELTKLSTFNLFKQVYEICNLKT